MLFVVLLAAPGAVHGQTVYGVVVGEDDGFPVADADVALVDEGGAAAVTAMSDSVGAFWLAAPAAGRYRVVVQRTGYRSFASSPLDLVTGRRRHVRIELKVEPIPLPGIVAETEANRAARVARAARAARAELAFYGVRLNDLGSRFISPESVAKREMTARNVGDIVRWQSIPGVRVENDTDGVCVVVTGHGGSLSGMGSPCALVVLNNAIIDPAAAALYPPEAVAWMAVLHPTEAVLEFGTEATGGALLIFTKGFR